MFFSKSFWKSQPLPSIICSVVGSKYVSKVITNNGYTVGTNLSGVNTVIKPYRHITLSLENYMYIKNTFSVCTENEKAT